MLGTIHTHYPDGNMLPSGTDKNLYKSTMSTNYLIIPSGEMRKYKDGTSIVDETFCYVTYANKDSFAYKSRNKEYKDSYDEEYKNTKNILDYYNQYKNTLVWKLLLQRYNDLEALQILEARYNSSSLLETLDYLDNL